MPGNLVLISSIANQLLEATAATATQASEQALAQLVEHFDLHYSFLRYSDHDIHASVLAAEWPPRTDVADPDPFAVIPFTSDHPALALCDNGKELVKVHRSYDDAVSRFPLIRTCRTGAPMVAAAPLISGTMTCGVLGFVKCRGRKWKPEAIHTLTTIASLFAQFRARISAEERLRHLAEHDDLTGLSNRRVLLAHLSDRLAARQPGPVAVLYIDLDRLKAINDSLGHAAGDWYIQTFADRLSDCAGSQSMVGRIGGDEFVVIPDQPMTTHAAEIFADQIRKTVHDRLTIDGQTINRTVSIGVAAGTPGRDQGTDLLRRADEAVLAAKRAGGNHVTVASDNSFKQRFRSDIERHLKGDIDSDALLLDYLPEVDLWTGAIVAAEALVRWRHPDRGVLLPDSFIGVAESMNLVSDLDRWVLRTACAEFSGWRSRGAGRDASLRVNVSPLQLSTPGFVTDGWRNHRGVRHGRRFVVPRDPRTRSGPRHRQHRAHAGGAQRRWRANLHRRLRYRLRRLVAFEDTSGRHAQDRPTLRPQSGRQRQRSGDCPSDHRTCRRVQPAVGRRGCRNPDRRPGADAAWLPPRAGVLALTTHRGRRDGGLVVFALDADAVPR